MIRNASGHWRETVLEAACVGVVSFGVSERNPFEATIETLPLGSLLYTKHSGTINRVTRARSAENDGYVLVLNSGNAAIGGTYTGNDLKLEVGGAFLDAGLPQDIYGADRNHWASLSLPKDVLHRSFPKIESKHGLSIAPDREPLILLRRYLTFLDSAEAPKSTDIIQHVSQTLIDLIGMAVGARGEDAEIAGLRGLRAARLQAILDCIRANYYNSAITTQIVAQQVNLSVRYVNELLAESGAGFSDRVLELRLQRAKKMLVDRRFDGWRISDVALQTGFGDLSYFNRCFRRRFGCTPTSAR
jgi:AraC-like DNA-binding protein